MSRLAPSGEQLAASGTAARSQDRIYFACRARQESVQAERAHCAEAANIHRQLARAYRQRAEGCVRAVP